jgi:hypothetical protein
VALQPCTECNAQLSDKAASCPQCGAPPNKRSKPATWLWVLLGVPLAIFAMLFFIGSLMQSTPEGEEKAKDRYAVEYCRGEAKRTSLDTDAARLMVSACEKLESHFRQKYGVNP